MIVRETAIEGVLELQPERFGDDRGWFSEVWNQATLAEHEIEISWVQDNESMSATRGTVRGLHYQLAPNAQAKLVRCIGGSVFDVAVDLRTGSPTFGQTVSVVLNATTGNQLLIPEGFAHGFCTLEPNTRIGYKVSALWAPESDCSVRWDDPAFGIDWPVGPHEAVLSDKDQNAPTLQDARVFD